ncbi:MAG: TonB-dependent siderophore receptor [Nostoc sp.]|uniref:TonB-dependent siderophore receptor n=1 Tax=Nostoc sp. TaxID=1180 RepID=UPI002FF4EC87
MINQLQWLGLVASSLLVLGVGPVWAQGKKVQNRENLATSAQRVADRGDAYGGLRLRELVNHNIATQDKVRPRKQTSSRIRQLSEVERPSTSAQMLVQSPTPSNPSNLGGEVVPITSVKANPTSKGVEVILETPRGDQLQVTNRSTGNNFIVDVAGGQLRLPSGEAFTFRSDKPIEGITEITVTNLDANTVRVTVVGVAVLPTVELFDDNAGLVFAVASTATATQPPQQPSQTPQAQPPENQTQPKPSTGDEPIELVVTGEQDSYRTTDGSTATKTDTPLRDIPQSIQVIPQQVLQDQQVTNLQEALRNVPGVSQGTNPSGRGTFDLPVIRGFNAGGDILRNGLKDPTNQYIGFEAAGLERIDVLKGPASVLYGQGSLGGVVNYVTKQPLREPYYSLEASAGNFNLYRGAIDFSGPLNDSKTVLYRLNAAALTTESFLDFYDEQKYFVAPVFSWQISDRTKLTLQTEYLTRQRDFGQVGLPAVGTVLSNPNGKIRRDLNIAGPNTGDNLRAIRVGYDLEHRFSENWQIRSAFGASLINRDRDKGIFFATALAPDNRTLSRNYQKEYYDDETFFNSDTYVVGKFATGSIQHQIVAGFNLTRSQSDYINIQRSAAPIDLFNPVYNETLGAVNRTLDVFQLIDRLGVYVQDQVSLAENLKLLLGLRFDTSKQTIENRVANTKQEQSDDAFSPRVGIVYQPVPPISLYASYSRAFNPVVGNSFDGNQFQPERGTQYEVGVKADLNDRLSATLAFYELTRSNVSITDSRPGVPPGFSIQTGEQRSRGIELNIAGEVLSGWNIIAGYAYTDAEITEDNNISLVGNQLNNVPKHSLNFWTTYQIQSGNLQGLGFSLGFFFVGTQQGDLANTFELPSYLTTDAAIFYKREQFRAALNFKNLFNVDYFQSGGSRVSVYPGEPFTVQGTISWQF